MTSLRSGLLRTCHPGSRDTQVPACGVSGYPRLAIFRPLTKTKMSCPVALSFTFHFGLDVLSTMLEALQCDGQRAASGAGPRLTVGSTITKSRCNLRSMAIGDLPVRSGSPQYFGPKNTGEDCELADKKKNDNRVVHDLLLTYRKSSCLNQKQMSAKIAITASAIKNVSMTYFPRDI
jgi:hypothetical protein